MKLFPVSALGLLLGLSLLSTAIARPPAKAQTEIDYLLTYIESSGCDFYRNGTWYDSKKAQTHLHEKFDLLLAGNRINTAEDFIQNAASQSSLTGRPYQVRCGAAAIVTTSQWLREVLVRYRSSVLQRTK